MVSFRVRQGLALLSGCLVHTVFGAIYTLGTVTPYIGSYLKYHGNPDIQVVDVSVLYPVALTFQNIGLILSMYLYAHLGFDSRISSP